MGKRLLIQLLITLKNRQCQSQRVKSKFVALTRKFSRYRRRGVRKTLLYTYLHMQVFQVRPFSGRQIYAGKRELRVSKKKLYSNKQRSSYRVFSQYDSDKEIENVVIIGSGPAGYTAAIYAARANLRPLVYEGEVGRGGQLMTTTEVENFPGFPEGVTGPDLMDRMRQQAARWGADLLTEDVEDLDLSQRPFVVKGAEHTVRAHSIIISTGATAKRLEIPNEQTFWSKGISACAICDGASPIFKGQEVAVVGGGDSACEEAIYLTKYAKHVHLLVRSPKMRASMTMQDRVLQNPKVTVHFNTQVRDAYGDNKGVMVGLDTYNNELKENSKLPVRGMFYGIGHQPNTKLIEGQVELEQSGYVSVKNGVSTSVEGVFAAGDLQDDEWKQAVTAAGSGCMAAISVERYLTANNLVHSVDHTGVVEEEEEEAKEAARRQAEEEKKDAEALAAEFDITKDRHKGQFALRKLYHESDRLLAVLYTAPTCGPCRSLKPMFNKVLEDYTGKIHFVEIDIEMDPEIAEAGGVNGTPTVQLFKDKSLVENLPGVKMKREYRQLIDQYLESAQ
eukprot:TRINITY_DN2108_c0_g4_i2.p1 TRINITY_DN2108_c0_g4~~TRINITY_DN2108_c0_g4_i2.p1  ORF type:complete len:562 (-),score=59.73 TRINITY_DN2108_c0_g4_i2:615-2300(-)